MLDRRCFLACAAAAPLMQIGSGNSRTLIVSGDSLSATRNQIAADGASEQQCYVALIAKARGFAYHRNSAHSGWTTTQMLAAFGPEVLAHHPARILQMGWANDQTTNITGTYPSLTWAGGGISLATTKANIKSMVQQAQAARIPFTLLTPPPIRYEPYLAHSTSEYLPMALEVVAETGCQYMDVYSRINGLSAAAQDALYITTDQLGHWSYLGHAYCKAMADEAGNVASFS